MTASVSVVVPCRNERAYVVDCVDSILRNDYSGELEVLIVDGASNDGTRELLNQNAPRWERVRVLDNPGKTAPTGLNVGIRQSTGDVIMRMDAHCRYPNNYISTLITWLERSGADNVGAVCRTLPGADTPIARAIAVALSHPFGVGNSHFRIGASAARWVDTVPFGCYRKSVFSRIGLFDEDLAKNQDDEFNQRLIQNGGRILLVPDITVDYFARDSIGKVFRMYYQYGYYKPLVARKLGRVGTIRQIIPALFVGSVLLAGWLAIWTSSARSTLAVIVGAYIVALLGAAIHVLLARKSGVATAALTASVFPTIHVSYGWGTIVGALRFMVFRRPAPANASAISVSR